MSSSIKLKNLANTEFSITHEDGIPAKSISSKDMTVAVDTVAAMQALTPHDGMVCIVRDLDRGGTFIYDSTKVGSNNQGTNFIGWMRQYSGAVNVKWFGAKGDGITDDSIAIQAAINNNESISIPGGTFVCNGIVIPPLFSGNIISGTASRKTILLNTIFTSPCITFQNGTKYIITRDLEILSTNRSGTAIFIDGSYAMKFQNLFINNVNYGINANSTGETWLCEFNNVVIDTCNYGFWFTRAAGYTTLTFNHCYVLVCIEAAFFVAVSSLSMNQFIIDAATSHAITFQSVKSAVVNNLRIEGCVIGASYAPRLIMLAQCKTIQFNGIELYSNSVSDLATLNIFGFADYNTNVIIDQLWDYNTTNNQRLMHFSSLCTASNTKVTIGNIPFNFDNIFLDGGDAKIIHNDFKSIGFRKTLVNGSGSLNYASESIPSYLTKIAHVQIINTVSPYTPSSLYATIGTDVFSIVMGIKNADGTINYSNAEVNINICCKRN